MPLALASPLPLTRCVQPNYQVEALTLALALASPLTRCIKPNYQMEAGLFDMQYTVERLQPLALALTLTLALTLALTRYSLEQLQPLALAITLALTITLTRYSVEQLRHTGMLQCCALLKHGRPARIQP